MKKVGLIYNTNRKKNYDLVKKLTLILKKKKIKVSMCRAGSGISEWNKLDRDIEIAIILGGDGTFLGTSRALAEREIPLFGINTGHLGFLTEGSDGKYSELIEQVLRGEYLVEERSMLSCEIKTSKPKIFNALNDIVINRGSIKKMLHLFLNVDGKAATDYVADGLIISTPTGSTAYALSAGGAVMDPEVSGIEIVPICSHSLTNRPHIISDKRKITIHYESPLEDAILQVDGQELVSIKPNIKIIIKRSKHNAKLVRLLNKESDFYHRLRHKFHWGRA